MPVKPLPKTVPITPSQSPPQSPSFSSARWRTPGSVPPQKRRRLSTPRRAGPSSVQDQPIDPDQAKAESERRMLDVWDRLAERYSRRIDEDDVVDLVTGDVIEDRGVLRSMDRWEVGMSADEDEGNDDRSAGEEEEESTDELNCLGDSAEEADLSLLGRSVVPTPAIDPDDPADAALLKEFSEAERRQLCDEEDTHTVDDADHNTHKNNSRTDGDDESDDDVQIIESVPHTPTQDHASESDDDFCPFGEDDADFQDIEPDITPALPSVLPSPSKPSRPLRNSSISPAKPTKKLPRSPPPQLQTPPRSSSSVPPAEVEDVDSSTVPLPSPSPTPTRPELVSNPRTHSSGPIPGPSKSRTLFRVEDSETPPPSLDLIQMSRRNKRPSPIKARKKTESPAVVAENPQPQSTVQKKRLKAEVVIVKRSRSQSRTREVQGDERMEKGMKPLKGKGKSTLTPGNIKEKKSLQQRSSEVRNPNLYYESDGPEVESDVSPPSSPLKGKGKAATFPTSPRRNQVPPRKRTQDLASAGENVTRKRKRVSDVHMDFSPSTPGPSSRYSRPTTPIIVSDCESSVEEIDRPPPKQNITAKRRSKIMARPSESDDEVYSFDQDLPETLPRRSLSYFNPPPPSEHYYPYPSAYRSREQESPYAPLYDPRAQYIISQAMHQLSALVVSLPGVEHQPPPHPPYTPSRHRGFSGSASSSMYNTPTQRRHPHPYDYDPALSRGTLPPSSPDFQSSPTPERVQTSSRASSLVARSRSRGRRVSFRIEEKEEEAGIVELDSMQVPPPTTARNLKDERHSVRQHKGKGNTRFEEIIDDSESEPETIMEPMKRGRSVGRAQTPAPQGPSRIPSEPPPRRGRSLSARPIDSGSKSRRTR
ncbi:hypothetical protein IW261DRAFT_1447921 [Armillaria novae-zelandiae]|uniref:Uncharacterized protein n=1 Tax=Armillaria novae-zelandiae TaxID=153914 RepID=A0AA39TGG8_9AGAR|nr:hypothetical protein IW261DRAFT_1447921 [Armillaria novae-zelandiae]